MPKKWFTAAIPWFLPLPVRPGAQNSRTARAYMAFPATTVRFFRRAFLPAPTLSCFTNRLSFPLSRLVILIFCRTAHCLESGLCCCAHSWPMGGLLPLQPDCTAPALLILAGGFFTIRSSPEWKVIAALPPGARI